MRSFVAGATGVIGRPLVAALLRAGHGVTGLTRSADRAEALRAQGAAAVVGDVFDAATLARLVAEARPEVVVHQLTALPKRIDPRKIAYLMDTLPAASNASAKEVLGWAPTRRWNDAPVLDCGK